MKLKELITELIFPSFCLNCQRLGYLLCEDCYHDLQFYFVQNHYQQVKKRFNRVYFDDLLIMAKFNGALVKLIKALKYKSAKNTAPFLARMLYRHLKIPQADLITFVPLHQKKLRIRGYNQSQEIAKELTKLCKIPNKNLLYKKKHNSAQAEIKDQQERMLRMKDLFRVKERYRQGLNHKTLILLDDVLTTGATLNAASKALKQAGAENIFGLIIGSKM